MEEMKKRPLIDQGKKNYKMKLVESKETPKAGTPNKPGVVLATLFGVLADFGNPTRNNRQYPKALWEKVLKDPLVTEQIECGGLFGEADHPLDIENRVETHLPEVSHIVRDMYIDDSDNTVKGYIDVLDTPNGRIIKTLIDYGYTLGVSSRGSGSILDEESENPQVDPDTYQFITFDIVARPSNKAARVDLVNENINRKSLHDNLKEQIEVMVSEKDTKNLLLTEQLISKMNIKNKDELLEMIDEGINNNQDDLNEALDRVIELRRQNEELQEENARLSDSLDESLDTIEDLRQRLKIYSESAYDDNTIEEDVGDGDFSANDEDDIEYSDMLNKLHNLEAELQRVKSEKSKSESDYEETKRLNDDNQALEEKLNQARKELDECNQDYNYLLSKYEDVLHEYVKLRCSELNLNETFAVKQFGAHLYDYEITEINEGLTSLYKSKRSSIGIDPKLNESLSSITPQHNKQLVDGIEVDVDQIRKLAESIRGNIS